MELMIEQKKERLGRVIRVAGVGRFRIDEDGQIFHQTKYEKIRVPSTGGYRLVVKGKNNNG